MATKIEWTMETWNPFIGCDKVSPGCENCYAIRMAYRLAHMPHTKPFYEQVVHKTKGGKLNWTGKIVQNIPAGDKPLRIKKPTTFFVNSMSDLFHKDVTFEMIDSVYDIMDACPQHTFQILTKRHRELAQYYIWKSQGFGLRFQEWPLKNVWVGISAENQKEFQQRIDSLVLIPAAIKFLSCEPLLGPINLSPYLLELQWVIVGGESGPGSRPMHPDWVRSLQEQCEKAKVPFFFKQWGEFTEGSSMEGKDIIMLNNGDYADYSSSDLTKKYGSAWQNMSATVMSKMGKSKAGNDLNERTYLEMPVK